jgi:hypothetical protein
LVWLVQTSSSPSSDSMATSRQKTSEKSRKTLSAVQGQIKIYGTLYSLFWSGGSRLPLHWVVNPKLLQGKRPLKTPGNIWASSNSRIKSYGPF